MSVVGFLDPEPWRQRVGPGPCTPRSRGEVFLGGGPWRQAVAQIVLGTGRVAPREMGTEGPRRSCPAEMHQNWSALQRLKGLRG